MSKFKLPHKLGKHNGKTWSRFTVHLIQSGLMWKDELTLEIVASSPAEALNAIKDEVAPRLNNPTEFVTLGHRGGIVSRFMGFESLIGAQMFGARRDNTQLALAI